MVAGRERKLQGEKSRNPNVILTERVFEDEKKSYIVLFGHNQYEILV